MKNQYTSKATTSNYSRTLLFLAFLLLISVCNSYGQVRVPFAPRTASIPDAPTVYTIKGDFTMIGNTNLTLENYSDIGDNFADMRYVDIDSDTNNNGIIDNDETANDTWNSSSATLTFSEENGAIPECSNIIYAGLYWTGRAGADEVFTVTNDNGTKVFDKRKVKLKKGSTGVYQEVEAEDTAVVNKNIYFPSSIDGDMYSAYAEVTTYVKENGLGEYFVADIATVEGNGGSIGYYGGWGMVVIYENSQMNWRNVTSFDGHAYVQGHVTANYTFDVDGFKTAENGYINIKLGVMAGEGDNGVPGDYFGMELRDTGTYSPLSHNPSTDPIDPSTNGNTATNFFNSSINTGGNSRNPSLINNTGVDIAMFDIDNGSANELDPTYNRFITNEQTSTSFQYGSTRDTYVIFNVTFSVDAFVPEIEGIQTITSINGGDPSDLSVEPGQNADYKLEIGNTGTEATDNTVLTIPIPDYVDFSDLSIVWNTYYTPTSPDYSDPAVVGNEIIWNLGTLPLPADPDTILADISFVLTATTDCSVLNPTTDPSITLFGSISGIGATSGTPFDTPLIQGYETDVNGCLGDPIAIPLVIDIDYEDYVNEAPTASDPISINIECIDDLPAPDINVVTDEADNSGIDPIVEWVSDTSDGNTCPEIISRIYSVTDDCNNSINVTQTITISDNTAPVVTVPAGALTMECFDASAVATWAATASANDNCDGSVTVTPTYTAPTDNCDQTITVTFTATDSCNNIGTATKTFTVDDNTAPVVTVPAGALTMECFDASAVATWAATASANDNCDGSVTVTPTYTAPTDNCDQTITVTFTATDSCNNIGTATKTFTVDDNTAPVVTVPAGALTMECFDASAVATWAATASANDNCDGSVTVTPTYTAPTDNCDQTITVTFTATDSCNNIGTATKTFTVDDNTAPVVTVPAGALTMECFDASAVATWAATASANDNCDGSVTVTPTYTAPTDNCDQTITVTFTATDSCNNIGTATKTFTVDDNTAPVVTVPAGALTMECFDASAVATWAATASANDNCDGSVTVTPTYTAPTDNCDQTITVTFTATDSCNNIGTATKTFTVDDNTAPVVTVPAGALTMECFDASAVATWAATASANDNCDGSVTVTPTYTAPTDNCDQTITVTFTATDSCNNIGTATKTFTVDDNTAPVVTVPAGALTMECFDASAVATWAATASANDNCDGSVTVTPTYTAPTDNCDQTITVTFTATDSCNNIGTATKTFTVDDNTAPVVTVPAGALTMECFDASAVATWAATASANDNCDGSVTVTPTYTAPTDNCDQTITVTFTATDSCNNIGTATKTFTVDDNTAPVVTVPAGALTMECFDASAVATWAATASANDNCDGSVTVTPTYTAPTDNCDQTITVTFTATDSCNNIGTATKTFTVDDNTAPVVTVPAGALTMECFDASAVATWAATASANDNCDGSVTVTPTYTAPTDNCDQTITVTFTATDSCNNIGTATKTFTVDDNTAPVVTVPAGALTMECFDASAVATWAATASANDNCDGSVTVTPTYTAPTDNCDQTITVTFTATDSCNNIGTATKTFTVDDNTAPVVTVPAGALTMECFDASAVATWAATASANDNCDGSVTVTPTYTAPTDNCDQTITVTFTATDSCNNIGTATKTFTVDDNTAPVVTVPAGALTMECFDASAVATWAATASANDNCDGSVTVTPTYTAPTDNCDQTITVTFTATDSCNNIGTATKTFTVDDNTAPVVTVPAGALTMECFDASAVATWAATASANDNCDGSVTVTPTYTAPTDNCDQTITVTFTATDSCNNIGTATKTFTVDDNTAPVVTVPAGALTMECFDASAVATWAATASANDNCDGSVTVTPTYTAPTDNCDQTITVTFTATDSCNNIGTATKTFTVDDNTAPVVTVPAGALTMECFDASAVATWAATASANDNCDGSVTVTPTYTAPTDNCDQTITVTFTATDSCNNIGTATKTFTVDDNTAPVVTVPAGALTMECFDASAVATWAATASANDNCDGSVTVTPTYTAPTDNCDQTITVTFTATDSCNNIGTATKTFTVDDNTAPVIAATPGDITVECIDDVPAMIDLAWTDNCDAGGNVTGTDSALTGGACGGTITRTWNIADACGNIAITRTQIITVNDTIAPVIAAAPGDITVECIDDVPAMINLAWTDNCDAGGNVTGTDSALTGGACGGTITRTWNIADACGNNAITRTQIITVSDNIDPVLAGVPANTTVECDNIPAAANPTATDNCDTDLTISFAETNTQTNNGTCSDSAYTITRTWTATDNCGNTDVKSQTITVSDNTAPTGTAPTGVTDVDVCSDDAQTDYPFVAASVATNYSDNCNNVTVNLTGTSQTDDDCGWTLVYTYEVVDDCGNKLEGETITYTGKDQTEPTIDESNLEDIEIECGAGNNEGKLANWLANNAGATATDNCNTVTWTNNYGQDDSVRCDGDAISVTFTATDECGNKNTTSATYLIKDTVAPNITVPASNSIVECDGSGNTNQLNDWLASNGGANALDDCSIITWSHNFTALSDECGETGSATVLFTATDACGNSSSTTATFTIEDTTLPFIDTEASDLTVECDGAGNTAELNAWLASNGGTGAASDVCSGVTWSHNFTALSDECGETGSATVLFTATDACGNASSTTATFTIEDTTLPFIDTEASDLTVECDGAGNTAELNAWLASNGGTGAASDVCSGVTWSHNFTALSDECGETGSATVLFTATDACGNASSTTATFTIEDTTLPSIDNTNKNDIEIECGSGDTQALLTDWLDSNAGATATDNCSTITWTNDYGSDDSVQCDNGAITVIFTATDECGNRSNTSASYLIKDTDAPIINVQASDLTVACDGSGNNTDLNDWLTSNGGASSTDACSTVNWSNNFTSLSDDCGATGIATVTFTATDACGNTTDTTAAFTIEDTTNPTLTVPADVTVECTTDTSSDTTGVATGNDSCSNVTITQSDTSSVGTCGNSTIIIRTWTATDECGNTTSAIQTITTEDTTPPTIDMDASNSTVECDGSGNTIELNAWLATNGGAVASDTCGSITWSNNFSVLSDDCGETGSATVIFTATDDCGNFSETTATFTIIDTINPEIDNTNKNDIEIECGIGDTQAVLTDWLDSNAGASATDSCSTITWTNDYGSNDAVQCDNGPITVVFTATDECGNRSITSATYLIKDTEGPNITVEASDLIVECDGTVDPSGALATWLASNGGSNATDDCSSVTWSNDFTTLSDECGATGSTTVIFTATDACGNTSNTTATFTIVDTTNPTWTNIPTNQTIECDKTIDQNGVFATWLASFSGTDTCGTTTVTNNSVGLSDLCGDTGSETVIFTLTDECGNSIQQTATFTIQDTIAPELSLPPNVSAQCSDDLTPISFGEATAEDNCDTNPIITYNDVRTDGACSGTYTITRTWTATDTCGNVSTADQIISTSDLSAPEFDQTDLPGNIVVECDGVPEALTLTATDNCGDAVVTVDDIITNGNCDNNYTITRTYTAMDDCGLIKTHVQTITVQDTIPPTFVESLPTANIVVECDSIPTPETLTATDVCGSAIVTVSDARTDGTCPNSYTLTRTWTATDECGLTTSHTQNIIVQDTTAPEFVEDLPRDMIVECDDIPEVNSLTATDNCGIATVTASDVITNGDCPSNYFIARTWTATDECGLTTSHTQIISVQDTTAPVVTSTYEETLEVSCTDIPDVPALEFTDNCSSESSLIVVFNETNSFNENVFEDYQIVRTWTVRDECKNEAVFSQTLNITLDEVYSEIVAEDRCYDDGIFNLNDLISDTLNTNGIWELLEGNPDATLNGSIFDPTVLKLSSDFLPDDGGMDYRFRYTTTHEGCISITEVIMNIHADCVVLPCGENDIKISTALTPNGDGYNDSFDIMGIDLCGFVANVKIFNRWGALVYESSNYTLGSIETSGANGDWNGSAPNSSIGNKSKLPNGTYYYIIKLQNSGLSPITGPLYLGTK